MSDEYTTRMARCPGCSESRLSFFQLFAINQTAFVACTLCGWVGEALGDGPTALELIEMTQSSNMINAAVKQQN